MDEEVKIDFFDKYISQANKSNNPVVDFTNFNAYIFNINYPIFSNESENINIGLGFSKIKRHKINMIESGSLIEFFYFTTYSENLFGGYFDLFYKRKIWDKYNIKIGGFYIHKINQYAATAGIEVLF